MIGGAVHVGDIAVVSLVDAEGSFQSVEESFPDVAPDHWAPWRELYRTSSTAGAT